MASSDGVKIKRGSLGPRRVPNEIWVACLEADGFLLPEGGGAVPMLCFPCLPRAAGVPSGAHRGRKGTVTPPWRGHCLPLESNSEMGCLQAATWDCQQGLQADPRRPTLAFRVLNEKRLGASSTPSSLPSAKPPRLTHPPVTLRLRGLEAQCHCWCEGVLTCLAPGTLAEALLGGSPVWPALHTGRWLLFTAL